MNTIFAKRILTLVILKVACQCYSQGFVNLNFESANVSGASGGYVSTSAAIPSWAAYYGPTNNPTQLNTLIVAYNGQSLGAALVSIQDINAVTYGPLQGAYSVLLQGSTPAADTTASIGQTGTIPVTAKSLRFLTGTGGLGVTVFFNSQNLSFQVIGNGANYTIYGADITALAGQTGQLLFTAPVQYAALIDNIQFSSSPIPEPSSLSVLGVGALFIGLRCWRNSKR